MRTVQLLGSTPLTRVAIGWFMEQGRALNARVVAVDPGAEDEQDPWFAPVRGLCAELGIPLGRKPADLTLDLDPDARRGTGAGVRVVGPEGTTPDLCRAILATAPNGAVVGQAGSAAAMPGWSMIYGDGERAFSRVPIAILPGDDGSLLRERATLRGIEALAAGWEQEADAGEPHPAPATGRFRAQERQLLWHRPAALVYARICACAGPWGGAKAHFGDTPVTIDAAEPADLPPGDFSPGTIAAVDHGLLIACGTGALRVLRLRASWRPQRNAAEYAAEVGASVGYQLT